MMPVGWRLLPLGLLPCRYLRLPQVPGYPWVLLPPHCYRAPDLLHCVAVYFTDPIIPMIPGPYI